MHMCCRSDCLTRVPQIWFIMWIVVSAIILLNFIVGVLGEAYNQVCGALSTTACVIECVVSQTLPLQQVMEEEEEEAAKNPKLDVLDIIAVKAKQGVGINVDLAALAGIEQKMDEADASGDGNVDLTELQKLMGDIDLSKAFPGKVRVLLKLKLDAAACVMMIKLLQVTNAVRVTYVLLQSPKEIMAMFDKVCIRALQ
jgi:hypothetical protein